MSAMGFGYNVTYAASGRYRADRGGMAGQHDRQCDGLFLVHDSGIGRDIRRDVHLAEDLGQIAGSDGKP